MSLRQWVSRTDAPIAVYYYVHAKRKKWRFAGINFDHMHMGDLLRLVYEHPDAEIVGICDEKPERMRRRHRTSTSRRSVSSPITAGVSRRRSRTGDPLSRDREARRMDARRSRRSASHILMEKPFAASLAEADRMIAAVAGSGKAAGDQLAAALVSAARDGQAADRRGRDRRHHRSALLRRQPRAAATSRTRSKYPKPTASGRSRRAGFTRKSQGGGSLLDYLGYGMTLGTWYHNGRAPIEVTSRRRSAARAGSG